MIKKIRDTILRDVIIKYGVFIGAYSEFMESDKQSYTWHILGTNISDKYECYIKINFEI